MRDQWCADNRDLVKWGVLVELAARYGARHILQVLYYRPTLWPGLEIDGQQVGLPDTVRSHFREATAICKMRCSATIEVIQDPFVDRTAYLKVIRERIRSRRGLPGIVFLDPDTGLEPGFPGPEHVLESELAAIWSDMPVGDLLVFYQHQTNRNGDPWIKPKKAQFERALGLDPGSGHLARAPKIASDVVFFFAQKPDSRQSMDSTPNLEEIIRFLNAKQLRATYGAVAKVLGVVARSMGARLGPRRVDVSWIVNAKSGLPTGYAERELHPSLRASEVIRKGSDLRSRLDAWRRAS
jgi:hypothetical protein